MANNVPAYPVENPHPDAISLYVSQLTSFLLSHTARAGRLLTVDDIGGFYTGGGVGFGYAKIVNEHIIATSATYPSVRRFLRHIRMYGSGGNATWGNALTNVGGHARDTVKSTAVIALGLVKAGSYVANAFLQTVSHTTLAKAAAMSAGVVTSSSAVDSAIAGLISEASGAATGAFSVGISTIMGAAAGAFVAVSVVRGVWGGSGDRERYTRTRNSLDTRIGHATAGRVHSDIGERQRGKDRQISQQMHGEMLAQSRSHFERAQDQRRRQMEESRRQFEASQRQNAAHGEVRLLETIDRARAAYNRSSRRPEDREAARRVIDASVNTLGYRISPAYKKQFLDILIDGERVPGEKERRIMDDANRIASERRWIAGGARHMAFTMIRTNNHELPEADVINMVERNFPDERSVAPVSVRAAERPPPPATIEDSRNRDPGRRRGTNLNIHAPTRAERGGIRELEKRVRENGEDRRDSKRRRQKSVSYPAPNVNPKTESFKLKEFGEWIGVQNNDTIERYYKWAGQPPLGSYRGGAIPAGHFGNRMVFLRMAHAYHLLYSDEHRGELYAHFHEDEGSKIRCLSDKTVKGRGVLLLSHEGGRVQIVSKYYTNYMNVLIFDPEKSNRENLALMVEYLIRVAGGIKLVQNACTATKAVNHRRSIARARAKAVGNKSVAKKAEKIIKAPIVPPVPTVPVVRAVSPKPAPEEVQPVPPVVRRRAAKKGKNAKKSSKTSKTSRSKSVKSRKGKSAKKNV